MKVSYICDEVVLPLRGRTGDPSGERAIRRNQSSEAVDLLL